jgi:hypothetical protein
MCTPSSVSFDSPSSGWSQAGAWWGPWPPTSLAQFENICGNTTTLDTGLHHLSISRDIKTPELHATIDWHVCELMKALVTVGNGTFRLQDISITALASVQILVKVVAAAQKPTDCAHNLTSMCIPPVERYD